MPTLPFTRCGHVSATDGSLGAHSQLPGILPIVHDMHSPVAVRAERNLVPRTVGTSVSKPDNMAAFKAWFVVRIGEGCRLSAQVALSACPALCRLRNAGAPRVDGRLLP